MFRRLSRQLIRSLLKEQSKDVQKVLKEELIKSLFATSIADFIRELLKIAIEAFILFTLAHVTFSVVSFFIILVTVLTIAVSRHHRSKNK